MASTSTGRASKLTLGFGLVQVPVAMKPLAESAGSGISGKLMCPEHGPTLNQQYVCSHGTPNEHMIDSSEIVKGYPHPDDKTKFVRVDPSVIEQIADEKTSNAAIEKVVDAATVDSVFYEKTYYCRPGEGGEAAFDLLSTALREDNRAAVASFVMNKRTRTIVFRWSDELDVLLAHVCHFKSKLRLADVGSVQEEADGRAEVDEAQLAMARQLLDGMVGTFDAGEIEDRYTLALEDAIRQAGDGVAAPAPEKKAAPNVVDLMAALEASVAAKPAAKKRTTKKKVA